MREQQLLFEADLLGDANLAIYNGSSHPVLESCNLSIKAIISWKDSDSVSYDKYLHIYLFILL